MSNVKRPRDPSGACYTVMLNVKRGELSDLDRGIFVGVLIGEGSFGGDGRQPQVTLRMHTRHEALFRWLEARFPRTKVYGPYHHGGRSYFQWMARGRALVEDVLPVIEGLVTPEVDGPPPPGCRPCSIATPTTSRACGGDRRR